MYLAALEGFEQSTVEMLRMYDDGRRQFRVRSL